VPARTARRTRATARRTRAALLLGSVWLALCIAAPAAAFEPKPQREPIDYDAVGGKVFDLVVLRPLGVGGTLVGGLAFLIAAPLSWYAVGFDEVWDLFVMGPVEFTFQRPLGDF
jgi:hypothetical protein